ncbi:MAG TPA: hypothetical protein VFX25_31285 [Streptosporangiaceae bacterium]|nr:hypothetical protein [Streptosporangiaceae bacterium]
MSEMMGEARPGWDWASPAGPFPQNGIGMTLAVLRTRGPSLPGALARR